MLATAASRWSWLGSNLAVGAIGSTIIMAAVGAGTGLSAAFAIGDRSLVWEVTVAHLNHVPAVLVVLGVAGLLFGLAPRLLGLSWAVVAFGFIIGTFGPLMNLPEWVIKASPFEHAADMPLEAFAPVPVLILVIIALALAVLGLIAFQRREINVT